MGEEKLREKLKEYFKLATFSQQFIEPILSIKTNVNKKFNENDKDKIFKSFLS